MILSKRTRAALAATTRFHDIREFEILDSTNGYLLKEARRGAGEGVVAVADYQTAGRGRLGRTWTAPPGSSLLVSVLLRPVGLALERRHLVTAAFALASADAVEKEIGVAPALKWPNDLLIDDRKLAGILAETERDAVVAGMGLNVTSAPPEAVSLAEVVEVTEGSGRPVPERPVPERPVPERGALLAGLLESLERWYGRWDDVAAAYRGRCATVGRTVRAELPGRTVVGRAERIDDGGHLLVRADDGELVEVLAGDVIHLRPS